VIGSAAPQALPSAGGGLVAATGSLVGSEPLLLFLTLLLYAASISGRWALFLPTTTRGALFPMLPVVAGPEATAAADPR